jgi:hypothetical protein
VRGGDLHAAVEVIRGDGEVQHVGRNHPVVDDVGAHRGRPIDERRSERRRGQPHVASDGNSPRLQIGHKGRANRPRRILADLIGIRTAHVVRFEDVGIEMK